MAIDGLVSGLDTSSIIKGLMDLERIPVNQMAVRQTGAQATADAYGSILSRLSAISNAANNLERSTDWMVSSASSTNTSIATASTSSFATTGSLTFKVNNLAASHAVTTQQFASRADVVTSSNSISLTIGGEETTIAVGTGTMDEVATAINSAGLGIRATVVNTGSGFRLQMSSAKTGAASQFDIDGFSTPPGQTAPTLVTATGRDAQITIGEGVNAYTVASSSNTFSDIMPGVTITAKAVSDESVTIGVQRDGSQLAERVKTLVGSVNDALKEIKRLTAFDASTSTGSILSGDSATRQATQALTRAITSAVTQSPLYAAAGVGVSVDRTGAVTFDETKFLDAYAKDPVAVERMFTQGATASNGTGTTTDVALLSAGSRLNAGEYNVIVTQAATQANEIGRVNGYPITEPATIRIRMGSTEIVLAVGNGVEHDINLDDHPGGASATAVADALSAKIRDAGFAMTASVDGGNVKLATTAFGSGAKFDVDWGTGDDYQTVTGTDVQGTINGQVAKGVGQNLSLDTTNGDLSGITLRAESAGSFTVNYEPGIAQRLLGAVSNATDTRFGYLAKAKEARETQVANIGKSIEAYEIRLDARELRLKAQWAALETMLSGLTSTGSMLASMTSSLENSAKARK